MIDRHNSNQHKPFVVKSVYRALAFIITLVIVLSCNSFQSREPTPIPTPINVSKPSVLESTVCVPPCWEGIIPGQTAKQEAIEILNVLKTDMDEISFKEYEEDQSTGSIEFYVGITGMMIADINYIISFHVEGNVVQSIYFTGDLNTNLASAIDILGEPEGVATLFFHNGREVKILYPSKGILLTDGEFGSPSPWLVAETIIPSALYLQPDEWDKMFSGIMTDEWAEKYTYHWDGYGYVPEKYPGVYDE